MLAGDTFDVTMDNKDSKVLALKHKIQDKQGTSVDCQELLLVDGPSEDARENKKRRLESELSVRK